MSARRGTQSTGGTRPFDIGAVGRPSDLTVVVGWRHGDALELRQLNVADEVADYIRDAIQTTVTNIQARTSRQYTADMHLERDQVLQIRDAQLISASALGQGLLHQSSWPLLLATDLPKYSLWFYAVGVTVTTRINDNGDAEKQEETLWFVRKTNPYKTAKPGKLFTTLRESLSQLEDPVFAIDNYFELILGAQGTISLSQNVFESFFRTAPEEHIPTWLGAITSHLPIEEDGIDMLADRCRSDQRLRRKLQTVAECGYLTTVTVDRVREYAKQVGIKPSQIIRNGKLFIEDADRWTLLQVLNEDLFKGGLSGTNYVSDRKSPR